MSKLSTHQKTASSTITWSALSVSGTRKPVNDDAWLALAANLESTRPLAHEGTCSLLDNDLIFAISDGMGGNHSGDVASRLILEQLTRLIPQALKLAAEGIYPDYLNFLAQAVQKVSAEINAYAASDTQKKGMGATLALIWFSPENMYLCNVGDSRIYRYRQESNCLEQLTEDHTFAWKQMKRGEISEREYREHPRKAALYEVIGGGHASVKPYLQTLPYQSGDQFLICSDGLVDGLWDKHIEAAFGALSQTPQALAQALLTRAVNNDGEDDTTLVVLQVK
ncbi:MAG: PP2C family protein-serine/threonine phosphatase [Akkermansiaceae bacterium]